MGDGPDPPHAGRRATRRGILAAGAATAAAALGGCAWFQAGSPRRTAAPVKAAASPHILRIRPGFIQETTIPLMKQTWQPWLDQNPGVEIDLMSGLGRQQATATSMLAGQGPDVFADWVVPLFTSQHLLLDLTNYVKQSNVNLANYPQKDLALFQQGGGLWGLPSYLHLTAPAVNLSVLDGLGLTYPESGWTWQEWGQLWQSSALRSTSPARSRVGYNWSWDGYDYYGSNPQAHYLKGFGGEYVDPTDGTKCYLSAPGSVACLEWIYGLNTEKVTAVSGGDFTTGSLVTSNFATNVVAQLVGPWSKLKWQLYDEPIYPQAATAYAASDFFAISALAPRPDIAWSFFEYVAVGAQWQRQMMHLIGMGPNQIALWPEWVAALKAEAPPLADKDLDVFVRQVQGNQPYFGLVFAYQDAAAGNAINAQTLPAQQGRTSVATATAQAVTQVDGIEAAGAAEVGSALQAQKAFPTQGGAIAVAPIGF